MIECSPYKDWAYYANECPDPEPKKNLESRGTPSDGRLALAKAGAQQLKLGSIHSDELHVLMERTAADKSQVLNLPPSDKCIHGPESCQVAHPCTPAVNTWHHHKVLP